MYYVYTFFDTFCIYSETVLGLMSFARDCFLPVKVCTYRGYLMINAISHTVRVTLSSVSD